MKTSRPLAVLTLAAAAAALLAGPRSSSWAGAPEALRSQAAAGFAALRAAQPPASEVPAVPPLTEPRTPADEQDQPPFPMPSPQPERRLFETPTLFPVLPHAVGPELGSFKMADRLDGHRSLFNRQLGALAWDISMATDSKFDVKYLTFARPEILALRRVEDLDRLRGDGIVIQVDAQTAYRFKVSINIFNPVRGSTLKMEPANGTKGPSHKMSTGQVLDSVKAKSFVFKAGGKEFWLLYGTDADPKTDLLADTRSLLFVNEAGLDSKAYPIAEAAVRAGEPLGVDLGGTRIVLVRTAEGVLKIHAP